MKYEQTLNAGKRKLAARLGSFLLIGCLSFQADSTAVWAQGTDKAETAGGTGDRVYMQRVAIEEYTVERGDCLWAIAEEFCGDGSGYMQIAEDNGIKDPSLILPGQKLKLPTAGMLLRMKRQDAPGSIEYEGVFRLETTERMLSCATQIDSELSLLAPQEGEGGIYWNAAGNSYGKNPFSGDYDVFCENISRRGEEILGLKEEEIDFKQYRLENGEDIYQYAYTVFSDETEEEWSVSVVYRFGETLYLEIIGIVPAAEESASPIDEQVLYAAGFFEEYDEAEKDFSLFSGEGATHLAEEYWDYEGLHNAFAVTYRIINGAKWRSPEEEASMQHVEKEQDEVIEWSNPVMEAGIKYYLGKTWDEDVYRSDLEEIIQISFIGWPTGDIVQFNDDRFTCTFDEIWEDNMGTMPREQYWKEFGEGLIEDLKNFPNLEEVLLSSMPHTDVLDYGLMFPEDLEVLVEEMSGRLKSFVIDEREYVE